MYKISYKSADGKMKQVSVEDRLGREFLQKYNDTRSMDLISIPTRNIFVKKRDVDGVEQIVEVDPTFGREKETPLTRFETDPPSSHQLKVLMLGFVYDHPHSVLFHLNPNFLTDICKSLWNMNNDRTKNYIQVGKSLIEEGKDMNYLISSIEKKSSH